MSTPPRQIVSPLNYRVPIVDPATGMPTLQFIQLLQKLNQNVEADTDVSALQAQIDVIDGEITVIEGDITTLQGDVTSLEAAKVPVGGAAGEVLTKLSGSDYAMDWQPASGGGGGGVYAPLVTGDLPGPVLIANGEGACIMVEVG